MIEQTPFIPHFKTKVPESFYDVEGNLVEPHKRFPVRDELRYGDSVVVAKGNKQFFGILHFTTSRNVFMYDKYEYNRYNQIALFANNNIIYVDRSTHVLYDTELEVYYCRVVLTEKWKEPGWKNEINC